MKCTKCGSDNPVWGEEHLVLSPGDTLLLYTDCVIDALGGDEQPFGLEPLEATARSLEEGTARGLQEAILSAIHRFVGDARRFDDITLVVLARQ